MIHRSDIHWQDVADRPVQFPFLLLVKERLPDGWTLERNTIWFSCTPRGNGKLPAQGWKIHVSASRRDACDVLVTTVDLLIQMGLSFKFVVDPPTLSMMNSDLQRETVGKFITVYPQSDMECMQALERLYAPLSKFSGPFVLSDRRYKDSEVLYYRYGGIHPPGSLDWRGELQPLLVGADNALHSERRRPWFEVPEWIDEDPVLGKKIDAVRTPIGIVALCDGRFSVDGYLQHSARGGVYSAVDSQTGGRVIVKEARSWVREENDGRDARDAIENEYRVLTHLSDTGVSPRPISFFSEWENRFLVMELCKGKTLTSWASSEGPLAWQGVSAMEPCQEVWRKLVEALQIVHRSGVVCGDLSPRNVIVLGSEGGALDEIEIRLIDFESSYLVVAPEEAMVAVGTAGYASPARLGGNVPGFVDDLYSLGQLIIGTVFPYNEMVVRHPCLEATLIRRMLGDAGVPHEFADVALALTDTTPENRADAWRGAYRTGALGWLGIGRPREDYDCCGWRPNCGGG